MGILSKDRSSMLVITVSGQAQHGKDSAAKIIEEKIKSSGKPITIHMADYLKFICKTYFGWDGNKDEKGRHILQYVGTDKVRKIFPNFWVDAVMNFIKAFGDDFDYVLIPDCRFPNEIEIFRNNGYEVVALHITRTNFENCLTQEQRNQPSERAMDGFIFDDCICSESGLDNLEIEVDKFIKKYKNIYW